MSTVGASSLVFDGSLELCDPDGHVSQEDYHFEAVADGASWGDAKPVEVVLNSMMRDGAITVTTGEENREATFLVRVKGADSDALDAGVQALYMATRKRTTLVWTPPDEYCEPRAWDVETSNLLEPNGFDDLAYMLRNEQVFRLRLVCLPHRRSLVEVVDDAGTPPSSGGVLLYACESTTGWEAWAGAEAEDITVDAAIFSEGAGSIKSRVTNWVASGPFPAAWHQGRSTEQVTGLAMDTDTGGYLSVSIRIDREVTPVGAAPAGLYRLWMEIDSAWVEVSDFVALDRDDVGFVRHIWAVDAGLLVTGLRFEVVQYAIYPNNYDVGRPYTRYDDFELLPSATTDHQIVKQHTVLGSARTTGSLQISAPSESVALSKVLAVTVPTAEVPPGFQPDGARWVTQGTTTADASALDGIYYTPHATAYNDAAGYPIFDVPVGMLTAGPYMMVSLVKVESSPTVAGVQAQLLVDGTEVGATSTAEVSIPNLATGWTFIPLGTVDLPPTPVQNADDTTKVRLLFKGAKLANVYFIPAWQVNGWPVADYSIVDCGTGTVEPGGASSSLFLDSPSVLQSEGAAWRGPTTDRANAQKLNRRTEALKVGTHFFSPGSLTNFVVSLGAAGPTSTLRYFPRYL